MSKILIRITFLALKLMGIKSSFSQAPIDYQKIRKGDRKNPPKRFYKQFDVEEIKVKDTQITCIKSKENTSALDRAILYFPGGAFISGPAQHHWDALNTIIEKTQIPVWMIDYPKSPEYDIHQISQNVDTAYEYVKKNANAKELILMGDSVGASLIMSLTQRLIEKNEKTASKLILITPVFDGSMTNDAIDDIDKVDPMLSKIGVLSAKKMCANGLDLKHQLISPLYGSFEGFPSTILYLGGKDIMYPDGILAARKMEAAAVSLEVIDEAEMPHIFPLLPIMMESKKALSQMIERCMSDVG